MQTWAGDDRGFAWPSITPKQYELTVVDPTHFIVDLDLVEAVLENHERLLKSNPLVAVEKAGSPVGYRLLGVSPGSIFERLGLRTGDILELANDLRLVEPQWLEALAKLRLAKHVALRLTRAGKPMTIHYRFTISTVPGDAGL